jgi:hypothetical protein
MVWPAAPWEEEMKAGYVEISIQTALNDGNAHDTKDILRFVQADVQRRFFAIFVGHPVLEGLFNQSLKRLKDEAKIVEVSPGIWESAMYKRHK